MEKLSNSDEVTLLVRGRAELNLQVPHILANDFVFSFFLLCHPSISIHQKFIKHHVGSSGNSSAFYTYVEAAINIPAGRTLAKFIEPTTPETNNSEGGV